MIGMILAAMKMDYREDFIVNKVLGRWSTIGIVNFLMIVGVTIAVKLNIGVGNYMLYSWICLPCFAVMIYGLSLLTIKSDKIGKLFKRLAAATYAFFLAQLFSNKISIRVIHMFSIDNNLIKVVIGWSICILVAFVLRSMELRIKRTIASKTNMIQA